MFGTDLWKLLNEFRVREISFTFKFKSIQFCKCSWVCCESKSCGVNQAHGAAQLPCLSEPPHAGRIFFCSAGMGLPGIPCWQQEKLLAFLNRDKNIYLNLGFVKSQSGGFVVILTNNWTDCRVLYNSDSSSCPSSFLDFISVSLSPFKKKRW